MENMIKATGENFILTFIKDGLAYPVALTDEQQKMFNMILPIALQGTINVGKEPIGKVITVGELKKMKERYK